MALDTQNKRRSVIQYAPFTIAPVADGTIGAADREQATWLYSGLPPVAPAGAGTPSLWWFRALLRHGDD